MLLATILAELGKITEIRLSKTGIKPEIEDSFVRFSNGINQAEGVADERYCFHAGFHAGFEYSQNAVLNPTVDALAGITVWLMASMMRLDPDPKRVAAVMMDESRKLAIRTANDHTRKAHRDMRASSSVHHPACGCNVCRSIWP